jgi:hypothetical protein
MRARKADEGLMAALVGGAPPPGDDKLMTLADFIGTVQRMEREPATSLKLAAGRDTYVQPNGELVVLYAERPSRRGPRTTIDYVLERSDDREVAAFQRAVQAAAAKRADLDYLTQIVLDKQLAAGPRAADGPEGPGVVGAVRLTPTPAMLKLMDAGQTDNDLAALYDDRFLLLDGLGRRRNLSAAGVDRAEKRIKAKTLAYLAGVLGRHARLVRSARAGTKMCVEGSEDDHGCVGVPARIFVARDP